MRPRSPAISCGEATPRSHCPNLNRSARNLFRCPMQTVPIPFRFRSPKAHFRFQNLKRTDPILYHFRSRTVHCPCPNLMPTGHCLYRCHSRKVHFLYPSLTPKRPILYLYLILMRSERHCHFRNLMHSPNLIHFLNHFPCLRIPSALRCRAKALRPQPGRLSAGRRAARPSRRC